MTSQVSLTSGRTYYTIKQLQFKNLTLHEALNTPTLYSSQTAQCIFVHNLCPLSLPRSFINIDTTYLPVCLLQFIWIACHPLVARFKLFVLLRAIHEVSCRKKERNGYYKFLYNQHYEQRNKKEALYLLLPATLPQNARLITRRMLRKWPASQLVPSPVWKWI